MRFFLSLVLILGLGYLLNLYLPFWTVAILTFVVGVLFSRSRKRRMFGKKPPPVRSFWSGFLAVGILWGGMALYLNAANEGFLATKMATLIAGEGGLPMPGDTFMILIATLMGGFLGGFSAMSGNFLGEILKSPGRG